MGFHSNLVRNSFSIFFGWTKFVLFSTKKIWKTNDHLFWIAIRFVGSKFRNKASFGFRAHLHWSHGGNPVTLSVEREWWLSFHRGVHGGSINWGTKKRLVYKEKSHLQMDDLEVPPFQETPVGLSKSKWRYLHFIQQSLYWHPFLPTPRWENCRTIWFWLKKGYA